MTYSAEAQAWLKAASEATAELSRTTLGMSLREHSNLRRLPDTLTGCYVALVGHEESLQIGLASDVAGCKALAQALLSTKEELREADVSDALGEIANILAGGAKKRRSHVRSDMSLGLPIVLDGHVRMSDKQELAHRDVAVGDVPVRLLVVCNRE